MDPDASKPPRRSRKPPALAAIKVGFEPPAEGAHAQPPSIKIVLNGSCCRLPFGNLPIPIHPDYAVAGPAVVTSAITPFRTYAPECKILKAAI